MRRWILWFWFLCTTAAWALSASAGPYQVDVHTEPAVIAVGKAVLVVQVRAGGQAVAGARVTALVQMPDMPMGEREGTATTDGDGVCRLPVQFAMAGGYNAHIQVDGPQGKADAVIPLATGQSTAQASNPPWGWLLAAAALVALGVALALVRPRVTPGLVVAWVTVAVVAMAGWYVVHRFRRPGSMTPIEGQTMSMNVPPPPGQLPVHVAPVGRGTVEATVRYAGQAEAWEEEAIYPRVTGILTWMPLYAGDRVRAGQVVARLDTSQIDPLVRERAASLREARAGRQAAQDDVRQQEAMVHQARAEEAQRHADIHTADAAVGQAQADLEAAEATARYKTGVAARSRDLARTGAFSEEEAQRDEADAQAARAAVQAARERLAGARSEVRSSQAEMAVHHSHVEAAEAAVSAQEGKLAQADAAVSTAAAQLQAAQTERSYTEVRAGIDGVVTQRVLSPGVLARQGDPIVRIARLHPIRVDANVSEQDLHRLRVGSPVRIGTVTAKVSSVAPQVDPASRTGRVEAIVPNPGDRLLPGQFVDMSVTVGQARDALHVPLAALVDRSFVWMVRDGAAHRVAVHAGIDDGTRVAVQGDLKPGDRVIVDPPTQLAEGTAVTPVEAP